jgi:hypothetical protein
MFCEVSEKRHYCDLHGRAILFPLLTGAYYLSLPNDLDRLGTFSMPLDIGVLMTHNILEPVLGRLFGSCSKLLLMSMIYSVCPIIRGT